MAALFGVRQLVNILLIVLRYYAKHQVNADAAMAGMPDQLAAMHTLLAGYDLIAALNEPGPS